MCVWVGWWGERRGLGRVISTHMQRGDTINKRLRDRRQAVREREGGGRRGGKVRERAGAREREPPSVYTAARSGAFAHAA